jgi:hypothetical protein
MGVFGIQGGLAGWDGWDGMDGRREGVGDIIRAGPGYRYYYTGCLLAVSHTLVDICAWCFGKTGWVRRCMVGWMDAVC